MPHYRQRLAICPFSFVLLSASWAADANLVLRNGRVWTGNPAQPWAEAVAIEGDRIALVGSSASVQSRAGAATRVIDLEGRLVTPGFNDAHVHFLGGSMRLAEVDLTGACTLQAMQERVAAWVGKHPGAPWVVGGGWEYFCFPGQRLPTKEDLDSMIRDKPAFLSAYDGHTGWANSAALRAAGITRKTDYSGFGEIVRDPRTGEPTGCLKEGAQSLVRRHLPAATRQQQLDALREGLKYAAKLGITSIQNASGSARELELWEELGKELTLRVSLAFSIAPQDTPAVLKNLETLRERNPGPWIRAAALKMVMDGVIESHTAAMLEPYSDGSGTRGTPAWSAAAYNGFVDAADKAGWQIYTHAIGDRAVRIALDGYEAARRRNGPRDSRHRIEHIEVISPEDVPRFAKLGVMPSMEPIHADPATVDVWSKAVGPARLPLSFPWQALAASGARLVFSSDWPAAISLDPIRGLHNAVNRQTTDGHPPGGWIPEQRVSVETALRAYTILGAYSSFEERIKGTIEAGKLADMIVLSKDLFRIPPRDIHTTRVVLTVVNGQIVYQQ